MLIVNGSPRSNVTTRSKYAGNTAGVSATVWLLIAGPNAVRQKICFYNGSLSNSTTGIFSLAFGSQPATSTADLTVTLKPGDMYEDWNSVDSVYMLIATAGVATDLLYVTELM